MEKFKNYLFVACQYLLLIVVGFKIANWFLKFDDKTNWYINTVMFSLIGFAYLMVSFGVEQKKYKLIFVLCGLYLIAMNFIFKLEDSLIISIIGIVCILLSMFIGKKLNETFS